MLWALSSGWITLWGFRDLAFRSHERVNAQLCARKIVNTVRRRAILSDLAKEQDVTHFYEVYQVLHRDRAAAATRLRTDSETRELILSLTSSADD